MGLFDQARGFGWNRTPSMFQEPYSSPRYKFRLDGDGVQVNNAVQQLSNVAQQNAASAEGLASSAEELSAQSESLLKQISIFKLRK